MNRRQLGAGVFGAVATGVLPPARQGVEPGVSRAAWVEVLPGIWKATVGRPEKITPTTDRFVQPSSTGLDRMKHVSSPPIPAPSGSVSQRGTTLSLPLNPHEEIYGFGLQFFSTQHRGRKCVTRVNADPRADTGDSHAPVPWYVNSAGYGVLIDTARNAVFYCGNSTPRPSRRDASSEGAILPPYSRNLGPEETSEVLIEVPNATGVDVYLFAGPTMLDAVRRYNLFSGGGVKPPEWGLGFWYRASSDANSERVLALTEEFHGRNIPLDVLGLEPGWQTHAYSCSFFWNPERFPDPPAFLRSMRQRDLHVNLWEHAFTDASSPLFDRLHAMAADRAVWHGLVPDFVDPAARKVFGDYHGQALIDPGIEGFKLDECDNSDYTGCWSFPDSARFPSGVDGEQMHSLFGILYQQSLWEAFRQRKRQTYGLVRSSGALAAPYPFVLYSDLYDHRQFVRALVNSGFSGLLWCPEVRDAVNEDDLIRRLETAVFSPLAMINAYYIVHPPWKQMDRKKNNAGELSDHWQAVEARCREIIGWRMQIVPYLRAAFSRYAQDGTPPFRALALDWPDVPSVARVDDAWMVGDRMLVAPLFSGEPGRTVVLPPGSWHDFWTGKQFDGNTSIQIAAGELNIPVFVKSGSVLPLATVTNTTSDAGSRDLQVQVFGDGQLTFELLDGPDTSLILEWNHKSGEGREVQSGVSRYRIIGWSSRS